MPSVTVTVEQLDHSASRANARGHTLLMDRPEEKGGQNKGPLGGETLLMGLGGCFMSNLLAAAKARDIEIANARVGVTGEVEDAPPRYTAIHMKLTADCSAPEELQKLVSMAERGCIASNTLGNALKLTVECG